MKSEKRKKYEKEYRERNKEKIKLYMEDYLKRYKKKNNKTKTTDYRERYKHYRETYKKRHVFQRLAGYANREYKNGKITKFDISKIAKKQKLICSFTGNKLTSENISLDHITPKSKGGINEPSNIRLVCKSINIAKQTMTDEQFIELCKQVVNYRGAGTPPLP